MGRSPCCEKVGLKKGPWTPEEDQKLLDYIEQHGHGSWRALPGNAGLRRCGKSCRLRWTNYLRPDIKRGKFTSQEDQTIIQLHALLGNRWSAIATHLPKRTDNEIKNYWNTHLKKRLIKMGIDPLTHKPKSNALLPDGRLAKNAANLNHMAQWESARLEAEARLASQSKLGSCSSAAQVAVMKKKPVKSVPCLDMLQAWDKATESADGIVAGAGEIETPNSKNVHARGAGGGARKSAVAGLNAGVAAPAQSLHEQEASHFTAMHLGKPSSSEHAPCSNFVEKFTDLLLTASSGQRSFTADGSDSGNSGGGNAHYCEDNKNYWNTILHFVNTSPSDSPIF